MSVGSGVPYSQHVGNGVTRSFAYGFTLLDAGDLVVTIDGAPTSDYVLTGLGVPAGGTVTVPVAPASGAEVLLQRVIQLVRSTEYPNNGDLLAETVNGDFDRLWMAIQNTDADGTRTLRVPEVGALPELPAAAARADKLLSFDSAGNPSVSSPAAGTATALAAELLSTASSSSGTGMLGWLRNAIGSVATTLYKLLGWHDLSVFEFMTSAQVADVQAYTYALDVTAAVQSAMNAAWTSGRRLHCPAGGYSVTGLTIPGVNTTQGKACRFAMYGDAFGEAGVIALKNRGTVFYSTTDAPILDYQASVAGEGNGDVEISHMALWGDSTTPVINLETLFGNSSLHHLTLAQSGTGDGVKIGWGATYEIKSSYIIGASYAVASGLGSGRTGNGIHAAQDTRSGGLQTVRKTTVAGWHTCIKLGAGSSGVYTYAPMVDTCELAFFYRGVHFTGDCESGTVRGCYFEGQDQGAAVLDEGNYNRVRDSLFFFNGGNCTFIDSLAAGKHGSRYTGNVFYAFNGASTTCVDVRSNATNGGPGKVVSQNHFILSAGTANVIGIKLQGVDPRVDLSGNDFQPAGAWTGSGTDKISDISTSSDTTSGSGRYGMGFVQSKDKALTVPHMGRGAVNLEVEPTALSNTNISAGVLTLGELSVFTFTPTGSVAITSFAAPNLPGKTFSIHVTATAYTVTFTHGSLLKLSGSTNLATGANGCWISFQIKAGGVAWETARVAY